MMAKVAGMVFFDSPLRYVISPVNSNEKIPRKREEVKAFMLYPYAHLWKRILGLSGSFKDLQNFSAPDPYKVPTLFLFGKDKNTYFHDVAHVAVLEGCVR